jgi:O-antigen ligase
MAATIVGDHCEITELERGGSSAHAGHSPILEKAFVLFALLYFSQALSPFIGMGPPPTGYPPELLMRFNMYNRMREVSPTQSDPVHFTIQAVIYLLAFILTLRRRKRLIHLLRTEKMLWILLGVALLSTLWSEVPSLTFRRSLTLCASSLFGLYLAERYILGQQLRFYAWTVGIGALLSLFFIFAVPLYGVMSGDLAGSWNGTYTHKNALGRIMVFGVLVFFSRARAARTHRVANWLGIGLALILIGGSRSLTAVFMLAIFLIILFCDKVLRSKPDRRGAALGMMTSAGALLAILIIFSGGTVLRHFGKDATLTGRMFLWDMVLTKIGTHPWLGYGYNALWLGTEGTSSAEIEKAVKWTPGSAHNGFLDLWLTLGLLGLSVFVLQYAATFRRALLFLRSSNGAEGYWPLTYLLFIAMYNFDESALLKQSDLFWTVYVVAVYSLHRLALVKGEASLPLA